MKALILAAGRGSRMQNLTEEQPKCLTLLQGQTLLDWQLQSLRAADIKEIAVVRGYQGPLLKRPGLQAFENPNWANTNMVGSLLYADPWLKTDTCIVSYSDIVYPAECIQALQAAKGSLVLPYNQNWKKVWQARFEDPLSDAESFQINPQGHLLDIGRKVSSYDEVKGQYMGLLKFTPKAWQSVKMYLNSCSKEFVARLDMTSLLQHMLRQGLVIETLPIAGGWLEVDSESDLQAAESLIQSEAEFAWMSRN